tara:strand:- start:2578 stop:3300 length:723 start_codon:yes stop_codon:yes gene_type:complete
MQESWNHIAAANFKALSQNSYPGRGIVVGQTPDGTKMVQVYWIMGRSSNSRNRIFLNDENNQMRTKAFDESKLEDPSLIIYYPIRSEGSQHIVSNGDQTDTIWEALKNNGSFESALKTRQYEPDGPNYTPRISALVEGDSYQMSILKSLMNTEDASLRYFFNFSQAISGLGHFLSTYEGDGNPLPSFAGEPRLMPLDNDISANLENYWNALNEDNRVSLAVKTIDLKTGDVELVIKNTNL